MLLLDNTWISFNCPKCQYLNDVELIDVKTEREFFCHNCKVKVVLKDYEALTHTSIDKVNSSIKELEKLFKKLGK